jgi:branched-chain amino acid transport system ATP-binding protein
MTEDAVLRAEDIRKTFGGLTAVNDVTFTVDSKETKALIGPNGAGKTTLLNCISGIYDVTGGSIHLAGEDITDIEPHEIARRGLGRTYQITNIFEEYTVFENVRLAAQAKQGQNFNMLSHYTDFEEPMETAVEILELVNLAEKGDVPAGTLAHGEQRQLEIGLALALEPDILLLDEPAAGMASGEINRITNLIDDLSDRYAILLVEHNIDIVMELSDSILVLDQGEKIADDVPEVVRNDQRVLDAYLQTDADFTDTTGGQT